MIQLAADATLLSSYARNSTLATGWRFIIHRSRRLPSPDSARTTFSRAQLGLTYLLA